MHGTFDKPMLVQGYLLPWLTKHKVFKKNNGKTHETNKITGTFLWPLIFYLRAGATRKKENYTCHRISIIFLKFQLH